MKILNISAKNIKIKPTEKKIKKSEKVLYQVSNNILPKEVPVEKKYNNKIEYQDIFQSIKDSIQVSIDNMKRR